MWECANCHHKKHLGAKCQVCGCTNYEPHFVGPLHDSGTNYAPHLISIRELTDRRQ